MLQIPPKNSCCLKRLVESMCFSWGVAATRCISVARSSCMRLQAQHLHTSAERRQSPVASLSAPELLSDLFTCSPQAAQAKRMRGIIGERSRTNAGGGGGGGGLLRFGQVKSDRGEGKEVIS